MSIFSRLLYCISGKALVYQHDKTYTLTPGVVLLIPSFVRASYYCPESMSLYYIHFMDELPNNASIYDFYVFNYIRHDAKTLEKFFKIIIDLHREKELPSKDPKIYQPRSWMQKKYSLKNNPGVFFQTQGIILQLLSNFMKNENAPQKKSVFTESLERKIINYIGKNIKKPISTEQLSELAGYSKDHFTRLFKKHFNITPTRYINQKRIEYAQMMIISSDKSISEIAFEAGFVNYSYFSSLFRKITGVNPRKLRNQKFN